MDTPFEKWWVTIRPEARAGKAKAHFREVWDAALQHARELGPCGKHPKACMTEPVHRKVAPSGASDGNEWTAHCTWCRELAAKESDLEISIRLGESLRSELVARDADSATWRRLAERLQIEVNGLREKLSCGHPKACWVPWRTVDCMSGDGPEHRCAWCSEVAVRDTEIEQSRVQMAGISTAAFGWGITQDKCAKKGDYGWSVPYQDVLELRLKTDVEIAALRERLAAMRELVTKWRGYARAVDVIARLKYKECADELEAALAVSGGAAPANASSTCPRCDGSGKYRRFPGERMRPCSVCGETGKIVAAPRDNSLRLQGKCTNHIWLMEDGEEPHVIGVRMDCGDSGTVYLTRVQAKDLAGQLAIFAVAPEGETKGGSTLKSE